MSESKPASANDFAKLILAQMTGNDVDRRTQESIDSAMAGAISDVRRGNPNQLAASTQPTKHSPVQWVGERPLRVPSKFETDLIDALAKKFVGGPNEPVK